MWLWDFVFTIVFFCFLFAKTCLSLTLQKKLWKLPRKCLSSQDGWEKNSYPGISAERYQRKHEMHVASKKVYWKNNREFQTRATYRHWKIYFFSTFSIFRCIFQISLKYIKLVIAEILVILVLCNFTFYFKIMWPSPTL